MFSRIQQWRHLVLDFPLWVAFFITNLISCYGLVLNVCFFQIHCFLFSPGILITLMLVCLCCVPHFSEALFVFPHFLFPLCFSACIITSLICLSSLILFSASSVKSNILLLSHTVSVAWLFFQCMDHTFLFLFMPCNFLLETGHFR